MVSRELAQERRSSSFDPQELTPLLFGGNENLKRFRRLREDVEHCLKNVIDWESDGDHTTQYINAMNVGRALIRLARDRSYNDKDIQTFLLMTPIDDIPLAMHMIAFKPVIETQTNETQKQQWLEKTRRFRIVGCYAQTELSHGSDFRGLQTIATYRPETEEFELNTPSLEATKWWSGALGQTATHAIVFARLLIPDRDKSIRDYGVHPFIVQIRDLRTHAPLQGITVGDIGAKMGFNGMDNGFLILHKVRIPRDRLLGRTGNVSKDGYYTPPNTADSRVAYSSMTHIRVSLVIEASHHLGKAATIAIRYLVVRRQFSSDDGGREIQVLDYNGVQHRVLPVLATVFAMRCTGIYIQTLYEKLIQEGFQAGELLAEVHASSSGLKGLCTTLTADGIEILRKACGGHGYSEAAGLSKLFCSYVGKCTAEGDNYLLAMLTTKFLLKNYRKAQDRENLVGNIRYIEKHVLGKNSISSNVNVPQDWNNSEELLHAFEALTMHRLKRVTSNIENAVMNGISIAVASNDNGWNIISVSQAHCLYLLYSSFLKFITNDHPMSKELQEALYQLCSLFGLFTLKENVADLICSGYVTVTQVELLHQQVEHLLRAVRRNAVALVDALDYTDFMLNSAIGNYDGNPYSHLMMRAKKCKINHPKHAAVAKDMVADITSRL